MRLTIYSMLALLCLAGCAHRLRQVQKTQTNTVRDSAATTASEATEAEATGTVTFKQNDSVSSYEVTIVPDSVVEYTAGTGFKGKARLINVRGKGFNTHTELAVKDSAGISRQKAAKKVAVKTRVDTTERNMKLDLQRPSVWLFAALAVLGICTLLYFFLRR